MKNIYDRNFFELFSNSEVAIRVLLDDAISFNMCRFTIANKVSKYIGILCKLRAFLPEKVMFMLYNCLYLGISTISFGLTKEQQNYLSDRKIATCLATVFPMNYLLGSGYPKDLSWVHFYS